MGDEPYWRLNDDISKEFLDVLDREVSRNVVQATKDIFKEGLLTISLYDDDAFTPYVAFLGPVDPDNQWDILSYKENIFKLFDELPEDYEGKKVLHIINLMIAHLEKIKEQVATRGEE